MYYLNNEHDTQSNTHTLLWFNFQPKMYRTCSYRGYCSGTHYNASSQQDTYTPGSIIGIGTSETQELDPCLSRVFSAGYRSLKFVVNLSNTVLVATEDTASGFTSMRRS